MAKVIIIGGGPAGCEAAHQLASQGIDVELVEKNNETGGNLNNWYQLFPDRKSAKDLNDILKQNLNHPKIRLHLGMEPRKIEKNKEGRFLVPLSDGSLHLKVTPASFHGIQTFRRPPEGRIRIQDI